MITSVNQLSAAVLLVLVLWAETVPAGSLARLDGRCPTGFANFGDSFTDTGNAVDAFPFGFSAENPPYGDTFFGRPAKRFSDGRVVPDFFSLAFRKPLLDDYFAVTSFNYEYGINFAVAAAAAAPTAIAVVPFSVNPYQVANFVRFKNAASNTALEGKRCANFIGELPAGDDVYPHWLYTIAAGANDLRYALLRNVPTATIINATIPAAVGNISAAITSLYAQSARKFLIFNLAPQGCSPIYLTNLRNSGLEKDSLGCVTAINQLAMAFNSGLEVAIQALRQALPDASFSVFDNYNATLDILRNPASYGFNPNVTFVACCGAPGVGSLNYNPDIDCGQPQEGATVCSDPEEYISWDGIHFTDHFYRVISTFSLSGKYTDNPVRYTALCDLDFSKFGPEVTLRQAYPSACSSF